MKKANDKASRNHLRASNFSFSMLPLHPLPLLLLLQRRKVLVMRLACSLTLIGAISVFSPMGFAQATNNLADEPSETAKSQTRARLSPTICPESGCSIGTAISPELPA